ncbi:MAG: M23 family metallopeptidase [bacterium]
MDKAGSYIRQFRIGLFGLIVLFLMAILSGTSLFFFKKHGDKLISLKNHYHNTCNQNKKLKRQIKIVETNLKEIKKNIGELKKDKAAILSMSNLSMDSLPGIHSHNLKQASSNQINFKRDFSNLIKLSEYYHSIVADLNSKPKPAENIPTLRPVHKNAFITAFFGMRKDPLTEKMMPHQGVDFADKIGTPVMAAAGGKVIFAGSQKGMHKAYGLTVKLDHGNNFKTTYAHLDEIKINLNNYVKKGQIIGTLGASGLTIGPHLHFEIIFNNEYVDPLKYLIDY